MPAAGAGAAPSSTAPSWPASPVSPGTNSHTWLRKQQEIKKLKQQNVRLVILRLACAACNAGSGGRASSVVLTAAAAPPSPQTTPTTTWRTTTTRRQNTLTPLLTQPTHSSIFTQSQVSTENYFTCTANTTQSWHAILFVYSSHSLFYQK